MSPVVKGLKGLVWIRRDDDVYHLSSKEKCDLYIYIFGKTICWDLFFTENTSTLSSSRPLTRAMNSIKMMKMYVNFQKWNQTFIKYNFADKLIVYTKITLTPFPYTWQTVISLIPHLCRFRCSVQKGVSVTWPTLFFLRSLNIATFLKSKYVFEQF